MPVDDIALVPLSDIDQHLLVDLMNDARVRAHLPLLTGPFSAADCSAFLAAKQALWDQHGFGPWAFMVGGEFAGWGGVQPEQGEADLALVLHPRFWGWGRRIFVAIKARAFGPMGLSSMVALLPPTRLNARVVSRLGFERDGEVTLGGERFLRFRLPNPG